MNGAFYIGATGLEAQQRALDVIANNIANINTTAYKRSSARFAEMMTTARDAGDLPVVAAERSAQMSGVAIQATPHVWTQGDLRQTGDVMDFAIDGPGFVELMGPAGQVLLARGETLKVNADGYLAVADGTPLKAMISVPDGATGLTIARDGTVSASIDGDAPRELGQINLVNVRDADRLADRGDNRYEITDDSEIEAVDAGKDGAGVLVQGSLEQGNVKLSDEMVMLLLVQRAYSANSQVVQASDQLMAMANGLRR